MEKVYFKIDGNLQLNSDHSYIYLKKTKEKSFYVIGDLIGSIINGKVYNADETFKLIVDETFILEKICRYLIGSCYILEIKDASIRVFCSCSSPGIYYTRYNNKLYFHNTEKDIYKKFGLIEQLDEDQLIAHIISHHILMRTPFDTLFNNIKKCPCGGVLKINNNMNVKTDLFIMRNIVSLKNNKPSNHLSTQVTEFGFLLENILELQAEYYKDRKLILSKSGGLDSSVIATALKKKNIKIDDSIYIPYQDSKSSDKSLAQIICKYLGLPYSKLESKAIDKNILKLRANNSLNSILGYQYLYFSPEYDNRSENKKDVYISGQNLDTLYSIDNFSPGTLSVGIAKWKKIIRKSRLRFLYTKSSFFLLGIKSKNIKKIINLLFRSDVDLTYKNFIITNSIQMREHVFPFKELAPELGIPNDIYKKYKNHRYNKLATLFVDLIASKVDIDDIEVLPIQLKNHYIRVLRFIRTVQNVTTMYHNLSKIENRVRILPYNEGPMVEYFHNYTLTLIDTIKIKRILHKYFKKHSGSSHNSFVKTYLKALITDVKDEEKTKLLIKEEKESLKCLRELNDLNNSFLYKNLKSDLYKNFIIDLYNKMDKYDFSGYSKQSMVFYRLINLDLFLKQNIVK